ncbi:MAG: SpoVR family protein [Candidatus Aenigmarchaeota archaeon]|nr:SpoVR family protein [Candidatus Aenigmarchaeota archaeon]
MLDNYIGEIRYKAQELGLSFDQVRFSKRDKDFFHELEAFGLPSRFVHWSFGGGYKYSKNAWEKLGEITLETVLVTMPPQAYLLDTNSELQDKSVIAHVYGHADFFKHNYLLSHAHKDMLNKASIHSETIEQYEKKYGKAEIEKLLDSCLVVCSHTDVFSSDGLPYFLLEKAPLDDHEAGLLDMMITESKYFSQLGRNRIINEGWASLIEDMIMQSLVSKADWVEYCISKAGVLTQPKLDVNPYTLGIAVWKAIKEKYGFAKCLDVRRDYEDLLFVDEFLTEDVCRESNLYTYRESADKKQVVIEDTSLDKVKERLIAGIDSRVPVIKPFEESKSKLVLQHEQDVRGGLDEKVMPSFMGAVYRLWKNDISLKAKVYDPGPLKLKEKTYSYTKEGFRKHG